MTKPTASVLRSTLTLAIALAIWSPAYAATIETPPADGKMARCQELMDQKKKLLDDTKEQNQALSVRVGQMNTTADDKKLAAVAAVITLMVEQRSALDARKATLEENMMQHMMQHMQMGTDGMHCPMMKGMLGMAEKDEKPVDPKAQK